MTAFQTLVGRALLVAGDPPRVLGAGIQLTPQHVLTCWHVIQDAADAGLAPVRVEVPDELTRPVTAEVVWSRAVGPRGDGDVALLRTSRPLSSAPATLVDCGNVDLDVRIVGHPGQLPSQVIARARLTGRTDPLTGWRQLDRQSAATVTVDRGFSGAGVFDGGGAVLGMVVGRPNPAHQTVAWMLPVRAWTGMLPADLRLAVAPSVSATRALSFAEKVALSRLLAEVPIMADVRTRDLVFQSLPTHIRLAVRSYGQLGLDSLHLIKTVLEFHDGFMDLYRVLDELTGESSIPLQQLHDYATTLRIVTDAEEDR
jgi:hypothetical protein